MNYEIKKDDWADFFESLSKRRYQWTTKVEVLNSEMGDQVLADGLRLNGLTLETNADRSSIDISVGQTTDAHQTHTITNPVRVAFLAAEANHGDVINIEEDDGTKTLITFIEPMGILIGYAEVEMFATAT